MIKPSRPPASPGACALRIMASALALSAGMAAQRAQAVSPAQPESPGQARQTVQAMVPGQRLQWADMTTLQGHAITADSLRGRMVLVQVWASWCPYCSLQNASLPEFQRRWERKGGRLLTLSTDKEQQPVRDYLQRKGYQFPTVMMPPAIQSQLGRIKVVPTVLLVGPDGSVLRKIEGQMLEDDLFELADRLPDPSGGSQNSTQLR